MEPADHADHIFTHCRELITLADGPPTGSRRGAALQDLSVIEDGAVAVDLVHRAPQGEVFEDRLGVSLREASALDPDRTVFSMQRGWRAATTARRKAIVDLQGGQASLYDLGTDPAETVDRAGREPGEMRGLHERLDDWLRGRRGSSSAVERAERTHQQLRALGYLQ